MFLMLIHHHHHPIHRHGIRSSKEKPYSHEIPFKQVDVKGHLSIPKGNLSKAEASPGGKSVVVN